METLKRKRRLFENDKSTPSLTDNRYLSTIEELVSVIEDTIVINKYAMRQSTMDNFLMKTKI